MERFVVAYTSPDSTRPQPASPIQLDPAFVYHQMSTEDFEGLTNAPSGFIMLRSTDGELREFKIVTVRPVLNENGNQTHYELFVL